MPDDLLAALLPHVRLRSTQSLSSGARADVRRVQVVTADGGETSYIVKRFHIAGEAWVRETVALGVLPEAMRAPQLVAAQDDPPAVVMTDLGRGSSLADALLGDDPQSAERALVAWAEALADLHAGTRGSRADFRSALDERRGELLVTESTMGTRLDDAALLLDDRSDALGVAVPGGAVDELRAVTTRLSGDHDLAALTPADTCPDNNVAVADGLALIDFEGAEWRHLAWDAAYLRVPWPTCWCAWRLPDDVSERALGAYRDRAGAAFPAVRAESFAHDVEAATVAWAMISSAMFLDSALGGDPPMNPARPTPTRRAMITHRLARAAGTDELPAVADWANRLHTALVDRWGDAALAHAPAFRTDKETRPRPP